MQSRTRQDDGLSLARRKDSKAPLRFMFGLACLAVCESVEQNTAKIGCAMVRRAQIKKAAERPPQEPLRNTA